MKKTLLIIGLGSFLIACGGNPQETENKSGDSLKKENETAQEQTKEESITLSEKELSFAKKWEVQEFYGPGFVNDYKDKKHYINLEKDGTFSCNFTIDEEEGKEIEGKGKWKLQNPKPAKWEEKIEGVVEDIEIPANQEVLLLTFESGKSSGEKKYLIELSDNKLNVSLPAWAFGIFAVAQ